MATSIGAATHADMNHSYVDGYGGKGGSVPRTLLLPVQRDHAAPSAPPPRHKPALIQGGAKSRLRIATNHRPPVRKSSHEGTSLARIAAPSMLDRRGVALACGRWGDLSNVPPALGRASDENHTERTDRERDRGARGLCARPSAHFLPGTDRACRRPSQSLSVTEFSLDLGELGHRVGEHFSFWPQDRVLRRSGGGVFVRASWAAHGFGGVG